MSLFKIKLQPIVKEDEWKVSYVQSGQKPKVCSVCNRHHPVGDHGTTFMKRTKVALETKFLTYHTCGHAQSACTIAMAQNLGIQLS